MTEAQALKLKQLKTDVKAAEKARNTAKKNFETAEKKLATLQARLDKLTGNA